MTAAAAATNAHDANPRPNKTANITIFVWTRYRVGNVCATTKNETIFINNNIIIHWFITVVVVVDIIIAIVICC